MKKLFFLCALFAVGMAVTSCSSDDGIQENGPQLNFNTDGEAFLSVQINTPATGGTRANDDLQDATDDESNVTNALLILFVGDNENDAKFQGAYELKVKSGSTAGANDVQKVFTTTIVNENIPESAKLFAYVAVNYTSIFTLDATTHTVTVGSQTPTKGTTAFSAFKKYVTNTLTVTANNFFMSNAPLSDTKNNKGNTAYSFSSDPVVTTLATVDVSKVYDTQTAAEGGNPAITVFVERAAVKVQVTKGSFTTVDGATVTVGDIKWVADNTEDKFYIVRNLADNAGSTYLKYTSSNLVAPANTYNYRFLAATEEYTSTSLYRIYWAEDPNYAYTDYGDGKAANVSGAESTLQTTTTVADGDWKNAG